METIPHPFEEMQFKVDAKAPVSSFHIDIRTNMDQGVRLTRVNVSIIA